MMRKVSMESAILARNHSAAPHTPLFRRKGANGSTPTPRQIWASRHSPILLIFVDKRPFSRYFYKEIRQCNFVIYAGGCAMNENQPERTPSDETAVERFVSKWTLDGQFEAEAVQHAIKRSEPLPLAVPDASNKP